MPTSTQGSRKSGQVLKRGLTPTAMKTTLWILEWANDVKRGMISAPERGRDYLAVELAELRDRLDKLWDVSGGTNELLDTAASDYRSPVRDTMAQASSAPTME